MEAAKQRAQIIHNIQSQESEEFESQEHSYKQIITTADEKVFTKDWKEKPKSNKSHFLIRKLKHSGKKLPFKLEGDNYIWNRWSVFFVGITTTIISAYGASRMYTLGKASDVYSYAIGTDHIQSFLDDSYPGGLMSIDYEAQHQDKTRLTILNTGFNSCLDIKKAAQDKSLGENEIVQVDLFSKNQKVWRTSAICEDGPMLGTLWKIPHEVWYAYIVSNYHNYAKQILKDPKDLVWQQWLEEKLGKPDGLTLEIVFNVGVVPLEKQNGTMPLQASFIKPTFNTSTSEIQFVSETYSRSLRRDKSKSYLHKCVVISVAPVFKYVKKSAGSLETLMNRLKITRRKGIIYPEFVREEIQETNTTNCFVAKLRFESLYTTLSRNKQVLSTNTEFKQYNWVDFLTDLGGFGKSISAFIGLISGIILSRAFKEKLSRLDVDYEEIMTYERMIQMSKQLDELTLTM